jgi:hypothetical protein
MPTRKNRSGSNGARWGALFSACLLVSALPSAGCGSKEETKTKSHHDDDDDTPSSRSSSSPDSYGTSMGTSTRRSPRDTPRTRDRDDEDPRRRDRDRPSKSVLGSLTDFVGDLMPSNLLSGSGGGSDIERAADQICECKDMKCVEDLSKKFEKMEKRKMSDLDEDEKKAAEKMMECMRKLMEDRPRAAPTARPAAPPDPDGGW